MRFGGGLRVIVVGEGGECVGLGVGLGMVFGMVFGWMLFSAGGASLMAGK